MSYFSLYFLVKTGLYYTHYIGFHWGLNLLLALYLVWPLPSGLGLRLRRILAWPLALALLYHDSFLPTPARVFSQLGTLSNFSAAYWLELLGRLYNPLALAGLAGVIAVYWLLRARLRFATLTFIAVLSVPLSASWNPDSTHAMSGVPLAGMKAMTDGQNPIAADPQSQLTAFYAQESKRRLLFSSNGKTPGFDIIVLHVCSLSWDDLQVSNEMNNPLLSRFDVLFSQFNSAASYSGPAAIRVMRGSCGQSAHASLYQNADSQCYVFPALEKLGYATSGLLNHDGIFDNFAAVVEQNGGFKGRLKKGGGVPVAMQNFDGAAIYDDYAELSSWWNERLKRGAQPEALYYNTITPHDGVRLPDSASRSSLETYKPRLTKFMADLDKFTTQLEASGKPVLLMLIPEHGASLRGDKIQISGMREIPSPAITLGPAAIKLIGLKPKLVNKPVLVSEPVSYFGLYSLLGSFLSDNPYQPNAATLGERLQTLEKTPFVSENEDVVVLRSGSGYVMKSGTDSWIPYQMN